MCVCLQILPQQTVAHRHSLEVADHSELKKKSYIFYLFCGVCPEFCRSVHLVFVSLEHTHFFRESDVIMEAAICLLAL